jgi:hypothetical protein
VSSLQLTSDSESNRGFLRWLRPLPVDPHSCNPAKFIEVLILVTPKFPDSELTKPNSPDKKEPSFGPCQNNPIAQSVPVQSIPDSPAKVHPKQSSPKQSIQTDHFKTVRTKTRSNQKNQASFVPHLSTACDEDHPPIHSKGSRKHEKSFHARQTGSIPFRKTAQGWANLSRPKLTHRNQVNKVALSSAKKDTSGRPHSKQSGTERAPSNVDEHLLRRNANVARIKSSSVFTHLPSSARSRSSSSLVLLQLGSEQVAGTKITLDRWHKI